MRKHFSAYIEKVARANDRFVFLTGDLGYNALENLQEAMGPRFINAGVAEQNMVGMAAGLASQGFTVVCYSIAPFVVYRCLEQVRNDVCFHNLPVFIVGNGGGYGYGIMGSSHHAIEDIAVLSPLPNMECYVPAFVDDLNTCMDEMFQRNGPSYLRLGLGKPLPPAMVRMSNGYYQPSTEAARLTIVSQGPVTANVLAALNQNTHAGRVELFVINKMPLQQLPDELANSIAATGNVLTIEEHVATGGLGAAVAHLAAQSQLPVPRFNSLYALGYPDGLYGSQGYHQQRSGLDAENISNTINAYF